MFGYIAPRLDQLSEDQRARYQTYYCGLCREMGKRSGRSGRLTLSHDITFLALLLSSLYEPEESVSSLRCAVHPLHPRQITDSAMMAYAADMNLLLMYYISLAQSNALVTAFFQPFWRSARSSSV